MGGGGWKREVGKFVGRFEARLDEQRAKLGFGAGRPVRLEAYRGFGRGGKAWVKARVLRGMPLPRSRDTDSVWINLAATFQRFESDEVPGARVLLRYPGGERELIADREGYVEAWFEPNPPFSPGQPWHEVAMELIAPEQPHPFRTPARILVPPASAALGVISDLDDTVVRTDVTSRLRMAKNVFLGNARTRMPFPGVASFYRALAAGSGGARRNPFWYVSSSPWNLYDLLDELLELRHIPAGPILLRDWGISSVDPGPGGHSGHKTRHIKEILALYPELPFILVGDSGQEDPEIYARAVHDHPSRILAVYIRNVTPHPERIEAIRLLGAEVEKAGSTLILADDTLAAAKHAAGQGWISPDVLAEIAADAEAGEAVPSHVVEANADASVNPEP